LGKLSRTRDNAILIFTGMSPVAHQLERRGPTPGWWEDIIVRPSIDTRAIN